MKVRIERIGAGQKEEALLRLAKEDGSTEKLRTYIETDSWKKVSILCKRRRSFTGLTAILFLCGIRP